MHLTWQPRPQGAFPWTRLVTPGLVEEKFESRFHHPCSNQLNITISTTDNQSIVTENRIYEIMEFSLKDKKPGKKINSQSPTGTESDMYALCSISLVTGDRFWSILSKSLLFNPPRRSTPASGLALLAWKTRKNNSWGCSLQEYGQRKQPPPPQTCFLLSFPI